MNTIALHFGTSGKELFGIFHPAEVSGARPRAILICNPFGQEEIRAHRMLRVLAERLARGGSHVLRFDYFGSGDSAGEAEQATLDQWTSDIICAHAELKDMSGANRVIWIGLGLGGSLAARAALSKPAGLVGVVLWEPVVDGRAYLAELARAHSTYLEEPVPEPPPALPPSARAGIREAMGFEIGLELVRQLAELDVIGSIDTKLARNALVVGPPRSAALDELVGRLIESGCATQLHIDEDSQSWNSDEAMNAFAVPTLTIGHIASMVDSWR